MGVLASAAFLKEPLEPPLFAGRVGVEVGGKGTINAAETVEVVVDISGGIHDMAGPEKIEDDGPHVLSLDLLKFGVVGDEILTGRP